MSNNIKRLTILFILIIFVCHLYGQTISHQDSIQIKHAISLQNTGLNYISQQRFQEAFDCIFESAEIKGKILSKTDKEYIKTLHYLAGCYTKLGKYNEGVAIELKVCSLIKEAQLENDTINVWAKSTLGHYYREIGKINEAIIIGEEACILCKQILGDNHMQFASSLFLLGDTYLQNGNLQNALDKYYEALIIFQLNNYNLGMALSYESIAAIYVELYNYVEAVKCFEKSASLYKLSSNYDAYILNTIALTKFYNIIGEHTKSIIICETIKNEVENLYGEKHELYLHLMDNLIVNYANVGNYNKSIGYTNIKLKLYKEIYGENHYLYALALVDSIALMCVTHNMTIETALSLNQIAIDILKSNNIPQNNDIYQLAISYHIRYKTATGKYHEAINDILENLKIIENEGSSYSDYLNSLAICYYFINDFENAIKYINQSLEYTKRLQTYKHADYIRNLEVQRKILLSGGNVQQIIKNINEEANSLSLFVKNSVQTYNETERLMWCNEINSFYKDIASIASNIYSARIKEILYNGILLYKGLLLNIDKETNRILKSSDNTILNKYKQLQTYRKQINSSPPDSSNTNINKIKEKVNLLERELLADVKDSINLDNYSITIGDIKSSLRINDIAIEFIDYEQEADSIILGAIIIKKEWKEPLFLPFKLNDKECSSETLYHNIWGKIIVNEFIKPGDNVYFSASGILHQIPIESLPIADGKIMSDVYNMHRLSSTRELVKEKKEVKYTKAALYGGLNYDMTDSELLAENQTYSKNASEEYFVSRGLLEDSIRGYKWDNLSNTQQEVDYISDLMKKNQITTQTYKGNKGNEESFKALSGHEYNIIHLATHGFFYPDEEAKEKDYFKSMLLNDRYQKFNEVDMSMWRSGLVLSGGNRAWKGDSIPETVEDGILKAQEIGDLDLRGADLVVLSACNTGQGEVTGEGVFGLQRAFKMAGAQTIVMSLTPVDDQTTMAMMNKFYTNLFSGQSKHDAFYNAQRYIRSIKPDPKYWMGWIMLD